MIAVYVFAVIGALTVAWFLLLIAWLACNALMAAREGHRQRHQPPRGNRRPPSGMPEDGRPLDDYEKDRLASVLLGFLNSPDDDSSDERGER